MAAIIQKACSFQMEDRYQTPAEFKEALVDYMKRNQVGDDPIAPPVQAEETQIDPEATDEEINQMVETIASQNGMTMEQLQANIDADFSVAVVRSVLTNKVMKLVRETAEIQEI
jgi:hypothetical protein